MTDYLITAFGVTACMCLIFAGLGLLADYLEGNEQSLRDRYENMGNEE